jgi:hypothetical protein
MDPADEASGASNEAHDKLAVEWRIKRHESTLINLELVKSPNEIVILAAQMERTKKPSPPTTGERGEFLPQSNSRAMGFAS